MTKKHISICMDSGMLSKLQVIAEHNYRSVGNQIRLWLKRAVVEFEAEHGPIENDCEKADESKT